MPETDAFSAHAADAQEAGRACGICQTAIAPGERIGPCPSCAASFHEDCWTENGGCAVYGCPRTPQTVKAPDAAPATYWGQAEKECPACRKQIKVAAVRCRWCGESFDTAAPVSRRDHLETRRLKPLVESMKGTTLVLFICGIIPFLAPLTALVGGAWFLSRRKEIRKLPVMNQVFCYVGLIASLISTGLIVLALVIV